MSYLRPGLGDAVALSDGYTAPALADAVVLSPRAHTAADLADPVSLTAPIGYTPPALSVAVTLSDSYTAPALGDPVELVSPQGYSPPALSEPVVLCLENIRPGTLFATAPALVLPVVALDASGLSIGQAELLATAPAVVLPALTIAAQAEQSMDLPDTDGQSAAARQSRALKTATASRSELAQMRPRNAPATALQASARPRAACSRFSHAQQLPIGERARSEQAHGLRRSGSAGFDQAEALRLRRGASYRTAHGIRASRSTATPWAEYRRTRTRRAARQAEALPHAIGLTARRSKALFRSTGSRHRWAEGIYPLPGRWWLVWDVPSLADPVILCPGAPRYFPPALGQAIRLDPSYSVPALSGQIRLSPPRYRPRSLACPVLLHYEPITQPPCPVDGPEPPNPDAPIPIQSVYIVITDVYVTLLAGGQDIPCARMTLSTDADSHTWSASLTLLGPQVPSLLSGSGPITLVAHVNGYDFHLIVDRWSQSIRFGGRAITAQCRGLTGELSSPWQPLQSGTNALGTVQQVLQSLLPSPWSVEWEATESPWQVLAGAWSYTDETPIGAAQDAVSGLGLVLEPELASRSITVQSRYPVAPWDYDSATPDLVIPRSAITQCQYEPPTVGANGVIVHGGEIGGELISAKLDGTAGDVLASTESSPLITSIAAGRERATAILSDENPASPWRSITIPLGGDFPLVRRGQLIEISAGAATGRETVTSVYINVTGGPKPSVRQTIGLGPQRNLSARFRSLIPRSPTYIATVDQAHSDTSTVTYLSGQTLRVRGTASVGSEVYIRDGEITGPAPNLPVNFVTL